MGDGDGMVGGGGGAAAEAEEAAGVVGVSGGYIICDSTVSLTSPSANCLNAEPTPLRDTIYCACEAANECLEVTVCFIRRFRCLHLATPSSFSTFELVHPIFGNTK